MGSDALQRSAVTMAHPLGRLLTLLFPDTGVCSLLCVDLLLSAQAAQLPLFYHALGLISSASPNATHIFHFEEFCQISSQRDSVNSYPTINVREPVSLTLSNGVLLYFQIFANLKSEKFVLLYLKLYLRKHKVFLPIRTPTLTKTPNFNSIRVLNF